MTGRASRDKENEQHKRSPDVSNPTAESMPEWWPKDRAPQRLRDDRIYKGNDGHWHHSDGRIANRKERRRAGVR